MRQLSRAYHRGPLGPHSLGSVFRPSLVAITASLAVLFSACEKKDSSVVDSLGVPPYILAGSVVPSGVNLDTVAQSQTSIEFNIAARITSAEGNAEIGQVQFTLTDATGNVTVATGQLLDNGVSPDAQAGDSIFTTRVAVPTQDLSVGNYICRITATSQQGYTSPTLLLPFLVKRQQDRPPVLSNLQAPDTIHLGTQSQEFKLSVKAVDPDGQSDIAKVFFNSYKPNGTPASGNPFLMYDDGSENIIYPPDGTSGDAVKGDSVYTLTVIISPTDSQGNPTALGAYRFEFQAVDRSNVYSQKLIWYVQVVQ